MRLKISAPTSVLDVSAGDLPLTDPARLAPLDGVGSDECFSDYLPDDSNTEDLTSKGVSGGYLRFRFRPDLNQLWAETEYDLTQPLTDAEIQRLKNYTLGQWSDGIGENFCPEYAEASGLFLSPHLESALVQLT